MREIVDVGVAIASPVASAAPFLAAIVVATETVKGKGRERDGAIAADVPPLPPPRVVVVDPVIIVVAAVVAVVMCMCMCV